MEQLDINGFLITHKGNEMEKWEKEKIRQASACPKHLLFAKMDDVKKAIKDKKVDQAITILKDLKEEHEDDESVYEAIASSMLDILLIDRSKKDLKILSYLFKKTEKEFFNTNLCVPVLGILLLLETGTSEEAIESIGDRMSNMASDELQAMLKKLPKDAHNKTIVRNLKNGKRNRS